MKRYGEKFGGSIAALSAATVLVSGCSQEVGGAASEQAVATETVWVTQDQPGVTTYPDTTQEQNSAKKTESILDGMPSDTNSAWWCGFVAARAATRYLMTEANAEDAPGFHSPYVQNFVKIKKTSIGFVYDVETQLGRPGQLSVRGKWAVESGALTPLDALANASVREDVTFDTVAVWNHAKGNLGGTTSQHDSQICEAAQDVVDTVGR